MNGRASASSCPHEDDVLALVSIGQWPARADAALAAHAASCPLCSDLALAAAAIINLCDSDRAAAPAVPDASLVWYRAQMQARRDAQARAMRPMFLAQVAAAAVVVMLAVTWLNAGATGFPEWWEWLRRLMPASPAVPQLDLSGSSSVAGSALIAGVIGLVVVAIGAVGFYLADVNDTGRRSATGDHDRKSA